LKIIKVRGLRCKGKRKGFKVSRGRGAKGNCNFEWGIKGKGLRSEKSEK